MAYRTRKAQNKREQEMRFCNCIVAIFQVLIACQSITFISGQGFLHPNVELQSKKLLEAVSLFPHQQATGVTSEKPDKTIYSTQTLQQMKIIRFEPPFLDFDAECVGIPKLRTVYVYNPSKERDLQLSSISARTSHFHSSFFEKKIVPPGGNTSFEVVFLARIIGNVENTLFINAAHRTFPYQVFGVGIPNPYRLRPYLGAKVPVNSSFSPLISMHNPTSEPLQVTEMYSSSGYLQLQLPSGKQEVTKDRWEIPPYETKQVMRANFLGQVEANHTAFIRIKTAQMESSVFHILPVEVEVSSAPGIYSSTELLDFGTIRTQYDDPKTLPLFLLNSGSREVVISSITLSSPNPAISIDFKPIKLRQSESTFTRIANITFSALLAKSEQHQVGSITVKTKEKSYSTVEIPFIANLLDGTLGYDESTTLFNQRDVRSESKIARPISLSNLFSFPVILQNVTLAPGASPPFRVVSFEGPITLPPYSQSTPFSIEFDPQTEKKNFADPPDSDAGSVFYLILQTNASKFSLPLHTYSGILSYKVQRSEDHKKIDFGVMGTADKRQVLFALFNHNPTPVMLNVINSTLPNTVINLVSLTQGMDKNLTDEVDFKLENFELPTNSCSVFEVTLSASDVEEEVVGTVNIYTRYQKIRIPVIARVVVGALTVKPERIKLPPSFPGLVVRQSLTLTNTFAQSTTIDSVTFRENDIRFQYKKIKNQPQALDPNKRVKVGKVYFDARQSCKPDRCYVGLPTSTTVGYHWLSTLSLGPESTEFDAKRYKELQMRWKTMQSNGLLSANTTLILESNVARNLEVPVQANLIWPSLLEESEFHFPLTHVGKKTVAVLSLINPADSPVIVQVLPISLYPHPESALKAFGWQKMITNESFITENASVFHLLDPKQEVHVKDSMSSHMVWLEYTLNGKLNRSAVNLCLDPGQRVTLKVEFIPYDDQPKSTVIMLRNNLTILDALVMHGRGAHEHLMLGGKSPNLPNSVLRFKITKEILKDCARQKKKSNPSFTVRKWFHANNTGMLPIHITSISVNGSPCEGYGFRVLDCDQFILQPNSSKKIEIAFTPDFTSFLILHKLRLLTLQGNAMTFILNVTLPPYMLPLCQEAVPRPSWEPSLYRLISTVMVLLFFGVLLMAYLEAINIWEPFVRFHEYEMHQQEAVGDERKRQPPEGFGKRFDLRNIASNFISTVKSSQQHMKETSSNKKKRPVTEPKRGYTDFTCVGYMPGNRQDISLQTDPHPDYPPLIKSNFKTWYMRMCSHISKMTHFVKHSDDCKLDPESSDRSTGEGASSSVPPVSNNQSLRLRRSSKTIDNGTKELAMPSKIDSASTQVNGMAEINVNPTKPPDSVTNNVLKDKNEREKNRSVTPEQKSPPEKRSPPQSKSSLPPKNITKQEVVSQSTEKQSAMDKRTSSKSNRIKRFSSSSSASTDAHEAEVYEIKPVPTEPTRTSQEKENSCSKVDQETKQVREKKTRKPKLSRKQQKAAREKEEAMKVEKEETVRIQNISEDEKIETESKTLTRKQQRQLKRETKRRSPPLPIESASVKSSGKPTVAPPISLNKRQGKKTETNVLSASAQESRRKPSPRTRSSPALLSENPKSKEKTPRYTIYKNPNASDSGSSSPQESSSSSESAPLWDAPVQGRDPNEEMMMLAKQSKQAEMFWEIKRNNTDRKRANAAPSPVLTSSSRSSSYSSMASASSSEGNGYKVPPNTGGNGTPSKKLTRSTSDNSGGAARPHLRKRNPYSPVSSEMSKVSPTHSRTHLNREQPVSTQGVTQAPTGVTQNARTLPSPSIYSNFYGKQQVSNPVQADMTQAHWSNYTTFGQSSFNIMENLIGTSSQESPKPQWNSPYSDSSLYSTPSPRKNSTGNMSPQQGGNGMRHWTSSGSPLQSPTGYQTYEAIPGTPTTPGLPQSRVGLGWGDIPSPTSSSNMSTHSIWSVSNAVTMDENRNTDESDPLGLKSIWSNSSNQRNPNWQDRY